VVRWKHLRTTLRSVLAEAIGDISQRIPDLSPAGAGVLIGQPIVDRIKRLGFPFAILSVQGRFEPEKNSGYIIEVT